MRVRTEEKRQDIIEVAAQLFQENGYDRTSMSMISERLGGSKATLYGYFRSKEELLAAVLDYDVTTQADELMRLFLSAPSLREGLIRLGAGYMERRLAPRPIALVRIVANQPEETGIGKEFYDNVLGPSWKRLAARFGMFMEDGLLRKADPWIAAMQWKGMVEGNLFDRRLLGADRRTDSKEIARLATHAAGAFLQLYGAKDQQRAQETWNRLREELLTLGLALPSGG